MYGPTTERIDLPIDGMSCAACASRIERTLNSLEGVEATVNYATEQATVRFDPVKVAPGRSRRRGRGRRLPRADAARRIRHGALRTRVLVAATLSLPVLLVSMIPSLQFDYWQWVALLLATPVVLWAGWPFHRAAWQGLRHGAATMDTLISVGTLAAWGWSVVALCFLGAGEPGHAHAVRRGALALGEQRPDLPRGRVRRDDVHPRRPVLRGACEAALRRRAARPARARREATAAVLDATGAEHLVPIAQLAVGDRFVVRPGEKIATDGVVEEGSSAVDQSLLTGESVPVERHPGDEVIGATVERGRAPRRAGDEGRGRHRGGADRATGQRGAEREGAGPAPRRSRLGCVRPVRDRPLAGDARLLAAGRSERELRVHRARWRC